MLGFTSGLSGLIQPRNTLVFSRHWEEKQNNTLNENNTIHTLESVLCPQTFWASQSTAVSGHTPRAGPTAASHTFPAPSLHIELKTLKLFGLAGWGLPVLEATAIPS